MKAALLDAPAATGRGVFLKMDETDTPGPCHVVTITSCDLPSGAYVWLPHGENIYGGEFFPLRTLEIRAEYERLMRLEKKAKTR